MNKAPSELGVALTILFWGVAFLVLPKFVDMTAIVSWLFYGIGFVLLLIGIMGTCIEKGK